MRTAKNDITGANLTTANKPMSDDAWVALYERIHSRKNPRDWVEDIPDYEETECLVCQKLFKGNTAIRTKCKLCS